MKSETVETVETVDFCHMAEVQAGDQTRWIDDCVSYDGTYKKDLKSSRSTKVYIHTHIYIYIQYTYIYIHACMCSIHAHASYMCVRSTSTPHFVVQILDLSRSRVVGHLRYCRLKSEYFFDPFIV